MHRSVLVLQTLYAWGLSQDTCTAANGGVGKLQVCVCVCVRVVFCQCVIMPVKFRGPSW